MIQFITVFVVPTGEWRTINTREIICIMVGSDREHSTIMMRDEQLPVHHSRNQLAKALNAVIVPVGV